LIPHLCFTVQFVVFVFHLCAKFVILELSSENLDILASLSVQYADLGLGRLSIDKLITSLINAQSKSND
jgi:hypothetical protein